MGERNDATSPRTFMEDVFSVLEGLAAKDYAGDGLVAAAQELLGRWKGEAPSETATSELAQDWKDIFEVYRAKGCSDAWLYQQIEAHARRAQPSAIGAPHSCIFRSALIDVCQPLLDHQQGQDVLGLFGKVLEAMKEHHTTIALLNREKANVSVS